MKLPVNTIDDKLLHTWDMATNHNTIWHIWMDIYLDWGCSKVRHFQTRNLNFKLETLPCQEVLDAAHALKYQFIIYELRHGPLLQYHQKCQANLITIWGLKLAFKSTKSKVSLVPWGIWQHWRCWGARYGNGCGVPEALLNFFFTLSGSACGILGLAIAACT